MVKVPILLYPLPLSLSFKHDMNDFQHHHSHTHSFHPPLHWISVYFMMSTSTPEKDIDKKTGSRMAKPRNSTKGLTECWNIFPRSHLRTTSSVLAAARPGGERKTLVHHGTAGLGEIILSSASGKRQGSVLWARFTRQLFVFKRPADLSHCSAQKYRVTMLEMF